MTGPFRGETPHDAAPPAVRKVLVAATSAFLFVAPLSGSAGLRATALLVVALAVAVLAARGAFADSPPFPRPLLFATLAWGVLAGASLAWSADRALTLGEVRGEILYGALALFGFHFAARSLDGLRLAAAALGLGVLVVMAAQGVQAAWPFWPNRLDGGGGAWSTHLVLAGPLLLVLAWPRPWGFELGARALAALFPLVLLAGWVGDNRMLWIAFAVQLVACAALWRHMPPMEPSRARALRRLMGVMAIVLAILAAAMVVERNEKLFGNAAVTTHLERDLRPAIWRTAAGVIAEAPVLGHGFGREIRAAAFTPLSPPDRSQHPEIRHGHNVFLDVAVQLGSLGVAAFVALLATLVAAHARLLASPRAAPIGLLGLLLVAGFVTKNLTDDFFHRHNAQVFWALNGLLLGLGGRLAARP